MTQTPHLLITGANGYIGGHLVDLARQRGWAVTALGRLPERSRAGGRAAATPWAGPEPRRFDWRLGQPVPAAAFAADGATPPVSAVIHLAHQWESARSEAEDENIAGTRLLLAQARAQGVERFVYGSSLSARPDALNRYGRVKHRVTQLLDGPGEIAARIGFVYGGREEGIWGNLCGLLRKLPLIPAINAGGEIQPIHVDDVAAALLRLIDEPLPERRVFGLAPPRPVSFGAFLRAIGRHHLKKRIVILPVPVSMALLAVDVVARIPFLPTVERERILGLAGMRALETAADVAELGLTLRPQIEGLTGRRGWRRRGRLREGWILLGYVAGQPPSPFLLKRYARAVEQAGFDGYLDLPGWLGRWPALLRPFDPLGGCPEAPGGLAQRLRLAATLVDACPPARGWSYAHGGDGRGPALLRLAATGALEALLLPLRALLGSCVRWKI